MTRTYADIAFNTKTKDYEFPDDFTGSVRPGSLDSLRYIKWGKSMTDPIEAGIIPPGARLMLDESYKHAIDPSILPSCVSIYVHHSNRGLAAARNRFWVWSNKDNFAFTKEERNVWEISNSIVTTGFAFVRGGARYVRLLERRQQPKTLCMSEPSINSQLAHINTKLEDIMQRLDRFEREHQ